jgi:hypothetical protein
MNLKYQFIQSRVFDFEALKQFINDRSNGLISVFDLMRFVPKQFKGVIHDNCGAGELPMYDTVDNESISFDFKNLCWRSIDSASSRIIPFGKGSCKNVEEFIGIFAELQKDELCEKTFTKSQKDRLCEKTLFIITHEDNFYDFSLMLTKIEEKL